jgi:putative transcriptional regulator
MNRKHDLPEFIRDALAGDASGQHTPPDDKRAIDATLAALAESLGPVEPPPALKARLLAAATAGPMRFAPFLDELGRLFDLGVETVVRILERAGSESAWEPGPHPAIRLFHLEPGPSLATADAGFVRMPASFEWPAHRHTGVERVLVLEGGYRESSGRLYRAGDIHEMGPNTEHGFTVLPGAPLLLALVLHGEIQML